MNAPTIYAALSTDAIVLASADPLECDCEFSSYVNDIEPSVHYLRECPHCQYRWYGHHCPHDGYQNPCSQCGKRPRLAFMILKNEDEDEQT